MSKYFLMHSGRRIYLDSISVDDICLNDIAHHLTKICRYSGSLNLNTHYSVASHSIALCEYAISKSLSVDIQRCLLMHDATEAYLGDINGILKLNLPDYKNIEQRFKKLIWKKYRLSNSKFVERITNLLDKRIILDEVKVLRPKYYNEFQINKEINPLNISIFAPKNLNLIKQKFLYYCKMLGIVD